MSEISLDAIEELEGILDKKASSTANDGGTARVTRVDADGTAWVHVFGGAGETPLRAYGSALAPGDVVEVRQAANGLYSAGNYSDPAAGVRRVGAVEDAAQDARKASRMAVEGAAAARQVADEAQKTAEATNQHFFADDNGAHITDVTQDEWSAAVDDNFSDYDPDTKPYHNQLLNSLGILLRTALNNLVSITKSAIAFYDGTGNAASNIVARFGADGAQIGAADAGHLTLAEDSMSITNADGVQAFNVDLDSGVAYSYATEPAETNASITDIKATTSGNTLTYSRVTDVSGAVTGTTITGGSGQVLLLQMYSDETANFSISSATVSSGMNVSGHNSKTLYVNVTQQRTATAGTSKTITRSATGIRWGSAQRTLDVVSTWAYDAAAGTLTERVAVTFKAESTLYYGFSQLKRTLRKLQYRVASTAPAFSLGTRALDSTIGAFSAIVGEDLHATQQNQVAIGKHNIEDTNGDYAFIIGNGTADDARSNALMVDWDGDVYPRGTKMADFIIEQGASGIWTYRKWNSGIMECWGEYIASIAVNISSGSYGGYRSNLITFPDYPVAFTTWPIVSAIVSGGSRGAWVNNAQEETATNCKLYLSAGTSLAAGNMSISVHAIGNWK